MTAQTRKPFNGKHMTAILVAGFGVVIAVNMTMATLASTTFGGVVVENSYVASQDFNRWLDEAQKEKGLGWALDARRQLDGHVFADLAIPEQFTTGSTGKATLTAMARHPLGHMNDLALTFRHNGKGWVSDQPLPAGRWILRFEVEAQGRQWRTEQEIGA